MKEVRVEVRETKSENRAGTLAKVQQIECYIVATVHAIEASKRVIDRIETSRKCRMT